MPTKDIKSLDEIFVQSLTDDSYAGGPFVAISILFDACDFGRRGWRKEMAITNFCELGYHLGR
jgi:hypothetical protein